VALGDVEFLEVAPREPFHAVVVGGRWVVVPDRVRDIVSGNVPVGSLIVYDSTTDTAEGWKGLGNENVVAATSNYAWVVSHASTTRSVRSLLRFRPSTSASTTFSVPGLTSESVIVAVGDSTLWIFDRTFGSSPYVDPQVFDIASGTFGSYSGPGVRIQSACWDGGSYIYAFGPSNLYRFDVSTGSYTTMSPTTYSSPDITLTTFHAGAIWWGLSNVAKRYDPATNTVSSVYTYGGGGNHINGGFVADTDGFLYGVIRGTDSIAVVDPGTLSGGTEPLPTSRSYRSAIASIGDKLYMPAGAPLTR